MPTAPARPGCFRGSTSVRGRPEGTALHAPEEAREQASNAADRLKSEPFGRLVSEGIFKYVFQSSEPADFRMDVSVTQADEVSNAARFSLGILAGRNRLAGKVALYDDVTGALLTDFKVTGQSASVSSDSDIEDAVRDRQRDRGRAQA